MSCGLLRATSREGRQSRNAGPQVRVQGTDTITCVDSHTLACVLDSTADVSSLVQVTQLRPSLASYPSGSPSTMPQLTSARSLPFPKQSGLARLRS